MLQDSRYDNLRTREKVWCLDIKGAMSQNWSQIRSSGNIFCTWLGVHICIMAHHCHLCICGLYKVWYSMKMMVFKGLYNKMEKFSLCPPEHTLKLKVFFPSQREKKNFHGYQPSRSDWGSECRGVDWPVVTLFFKTMCTQHLFYLLRWKAAVEHYQSFQLHVSVPLSPPPFISFESYPLVW